MVRGPLQFSVSSDSSLDARGGTGGFGRPTGFSFTRTGASVPQTHLYQRDCFDWFRPVGWERSGPGRGGTWWRYLGEGRRARRSIGSAVSKEAASCRYVSSKKVIYRGGVGAVNVAKVNKASMKAMMEKETTLKFDKELVKIKPFKVLWKKYEIYL